LKLLQRRLKHAQCQDLRCEVDRTWLRDKQTITAISSP